MFGYIVVNKPEMKFREYDEYHGFYCGLCASLKRYGSLKRLTLNYDMCFLAILLTSLYEKEAKKEMIHCPIHPFKKMESYHNELIDYCADMTLILSYHKGLDDVYDEGSLKGRAISSLLARNYADLVKKYPQKCLNISEALKESNALELEENVNLDVLSSCSGRMLASIFCYREDEWSRYLSEIGFYLGKFVYLMDAYDDLEKDIEHGRFNPFKNRYQQEGFDDWVYDLLEMMMADCAAAFEKLPLFEYREILRNILYSGVFGRYDMVRKQRKEKQK